MEAYRAKYLFPIVGPPIADGVLRFDSFIREFDSQHSSPGIIDLGNVAIVPALVNAHAHLELSHFDRPLGSPGMRFPDWIREIIAWRRAQPPTLAEQQLAIIKGLHECERHGVGIVADIASPGELPSEFTTLRWTFQEVLGLSTAKADGLFAQAESFISAHPFHSGISPHAPYTVGIELLSRLSKLSRERQFPLAMHLAESPDELELLRSHSGAFHALLTELNAWDPSALPRGIDVAEYLRVLATAHRALVIHGNYLSSDEIAFLAAHRATMSVVYCPRTHAFFQHSRYPLVEMLAAGVNVALGTDSRASSPDLNLWDDLRWVADTFPELPLADILQLGTHHGAQALLGSETKLGTLQPGAPVRLQVIELPNEAAADPYELLFDSQARVRELIVR
jgi:cytosine/adenosine deaminase-related metal-dependent hydrolase